MQTDNRFKVLIVNIRNASFQPQLTLSYILPTMLPEKSLKGAVSFGHEMKVLHDLYTIQLKLYM